MMMPTTEPSDLALMLLRSLLFTSQLSQLKSFSGSPLSSFRP